jgi:ADP-heptose:LPS heptosyltransferase
MARILVIRFSAIGDVAMTVPVITSLAEQYSQHEFIILSQHFLQPLFENAPSNVIFYGIKLADYKGLKGLRRLYGELRNFKFDYVADLHNVLRSKFLRFRFIRSGASVRQIEKGRISKWKLVRRYFKVLKPLKSSFERYAQVFRKLGFSTEIDFVSIYGKGKAPFSMIEPFVGTKEEGVKWIGVAPFAKHKGKIYPLELQEQVLAHFAGKPHYKIFLFGGGQKEIAVFNTWAEKYQGVISVAGRLDLQTELALISHLDVMLAMDSANMHFASIVNTPTVSVWGATHLYAGFMGWKQQPDSIVQIDLRCRPCSVFGQKPCWRKDYACLYGISPEEIIKKVTIACKDRANEDTNPN